MPLVTWYDQASLHRETCIAVLDTFLPHGAVRKLATAVGVSPQWFTYFRQADSFSMPSLRLARRIAERLPAPRAHRQAFYEHLAAARGAYNQARQELHATVAARLPVHDYLRELNATFYAANFGPDPASTVNAYQCALALGQLIVRQVPPDRYPLEVIEACGTLLHLCVAQDKIPDGLYWIKVGNHIAQAITPQDLSTPSQHERLRHLRYLTARDEALGYHHLGNDKTALHYFAQAEQMLLDHPNPRSQQGDLARNRLLALPGTTRFAIGEAEALAQQALPIFEAKNDVLGILLNQQAIAHALIVHGNGKSLKRAEIGLRDLFAQLDTLPNAGQIHRAVVLDTVAQLHWRRGDQSGWQDVMHRLLPILRQSGLLHFHHRLEREYGAELTLVIESMFS